MDPHLCWVLPDFNPRQYNFEAMYVYACTKRLHCVVEICSTEEKKRWFSNWNIQLPKTLEPHNIKVVYITNFIYNILNLTTCVGSNSGIDFHFMSYSVVSLLERKGNILGHMNPKPNGHWKDQTKLRSVSISSSFIFLHKSAFYIHSRW